jgi:hypothetical protein
MANKRMFISFDYDHDLDIKTLLVGQAKNSDSPFDFIDASIKEHLDGDWKEKARRRLRNCDVICVLCGEYTHKAPGVNAELQIAQELSLPYFLLWGRSDKGCKPPPSAKSNDKIYRWDWDTLKSLLAGAR